MPNTHWAKVGGATLFALMFLALLALLGGGKPERVCTGAGCWQRECAVPNADGAAGLFAPCQVGRP